MLKFRFLDLALWRMDLEPMRVGAAYPLATNAKRVVYDPPRVIARFQESFEESVRDYLHLVMHCIFRHPFNEDHDNREAWGLTCDIIVENAVMDMCGGRFESADDPARRQAISEIRMLAGSLLPYKVYYLIKGIVLTPGGQQYRGLGRSVLNEWHALFERDDHGAWPANNDARSDAPGEDGVEEFAEDDEDPDVQADAVHTETLGEDAPADDGGRDAGAQAADDAGAAEGGLQEEDGTEEVDASDDEAGDADVSDDSDGDDSSAGQAPETRLPDARERDEVRDDDFDAEREKKEWEEISKQIEMNLETFSREWGDEAGSLMANLAFANRKTYGYTDFLRQFMVSTEEMRLNMDEFDYVYYSYGMDLYGNMPLVEPLEYQETERIRDFVIVIDTSESVSGELVKRFVQHTFDILKSSQDFTHEVNVHLIQCDARVQSDVKITDLRDVDKLVEGFVLRGFGGTDFRPAFDYVEMLRRRGELANMRGLVYFTDGFGAFPEKAPDFDAAFVFVDEEGERHPPVPPWAMKILIDEESIGRLGK